MRRLLLLLSTLILAMLLAACATSPGEQTPNPELAAKYVTNAQNLENKGVLP